jgi:predicted RNase H-like nuclease (RuvC/YqgF family)
MLCDKCNTKEIEKEHLRIQINDLRKQLKEKDEMIETLKHTIENQSGDKF